MKTIIWIIFCLLCTLMAIATTTGLRLKPEPRDGRNLHVRHLQKSLTIDCYGPVKENPTEPCWSAPHRSKLQEDGKPGGVDDDGNIIFHSKLMLDTFKYDDVGTYTCTFPDDQIKITLNLQEEIQKCEDGKYGLGCTEDCSEFCLLSGATESPCYYTNGTCRFGCKEGYMGPFCTCKTVSSELSAGFIASIVIAILEAIALIALIIYRYVTNKQKRNEGLPYTIPEEMKREQLEKDSEECEKLSQKIDNLQQFLTQSYGNINSVLNELNVHLPDRLAERLKTNAYFEAELDKYKTKLKKKKRELEKLKTEMEELERKKGFTDIRNIKPDPVQRTQAAASSSYDTTPLLETRGPFAADWLAEEQEAGVSLKKEV